jgi:hypothetical protein
MEEAMVPHSNNTTCLRACAAILLLSLPVLTSHAQNIQSPPSAIRSDSRAGMPSVDMKSLGGVNQFPGLAGSPGAIPGKQVGTGAANIKVNWCEAEQAEIKSLKELNALLEQKISELEAPKKTASNAGGKK